MRKINVYAGIAGMLLIFLFAQSCTQYQRLLKSDDYELKYKRALEYFEEGEYGRTIALLQDIIPIYRGTAEAQRISYYFSMSHFHNREYTLASHYFKTYVSAYPQSEHAEEFLFLSAYCHYLESPRYSLDQSNTRQAIRELQSFINRFPGSDRVADANELIDELRSKLEKKRFKTGKLFLDISDYVAAAKTFETMIRDFPDTEYREEAMFLTIKAYFNFAYNSVPQRQEERYQDVISAYNQFVRRYPQSQFMREAQQMENTAREVIDRSQQRRQEEMELTGNND